MNEITDYDILTGKTATELTHKVKEAIKYGWQPVGSIILFAENELFTWGKCVKEGGKIFLHDTDDAETFYGVRGAIMEYCRYHIKLFWLYPDSNGLGEIQC